MGTEDARHCPACHARDGRPAGSAGGFPLRRCRSCQTLFTAQLPDPGRLQDYDSYYHVGNLEVPDFVRGRLVEIVAPFDRYRQLNRWLDVGFGAGALMRAAASLGWEVAGTEVSASAAAAVEKEGFEVHLVEVQELDVQDGTFDVVSMVEVLEHVPEPDILLMSAARLLRPGGALYVTTPHARGISARLLRTSWSVVSPPEHLQLFSIHGIGEALARAGFVQRNLQTHAVNPVELAAALRRSRANETPVNRVETSYRLNEALSSGGAGAVTKRLVNGALNATRLGDGLKVLATTARR